MIDLANKTEIEEVLEKKLEIVHDNHWSFGFFILSINNLDELVEEYGIKIKSNILEDIVAVINNNLRNFDRFGMWSDNKLIVIIMNIYIGDLKIIANKYKRIIESQKIPGNIDLDFDIVGSTNRTNDNFNSLVKRIEHLLNDKNYYQQLVRIVE